MLYADKVGTTTQECEANDYARMLQRMQSHRRSSKKFRKYRTAAIQIRTLIETYIRFPGLRII